MLSVSSLNRRDANGCPTSVLLLSERIILQFDDRQKGWLRGFKFTLSDEIA